MMTNKSHMMVSSYHDSPRDHDHSFNQVNQGEQYVWETHRVQLSRVHGYGFGIAISGGVDNPHFPNGDPAIAVCDVLNAGPAAGKIEVNDRIVSVDEHSLETVYHATAISILNNSPDTIELVLRRKVYLDLNEKEPAPLKVVLKKKSKRDEYGLEFGHCLYVKRIVGNSLAAQEGGLKEGDIILKLNNMTADNLSLNECHRIMERSRDKVNLIVVKDPNERRPYSDLPPKIDNTDLSQSQHLDLEDTVLSQHQPLDQAPVRPPLPNQFDSPRDGPPPYYDPDGRPNYDPDGRPNYGPRLQPVGAPGRDLDEKDVGMSRRTTWNPEPRRISFRKSKGGVGIRLAGGNNVGIFIAAVQPDTVAYEQGLQEGDMLLQINNTDMVSKTREDAVLLLLSLESQVELLIQYKKDEYDRFINSNEFGDSFYVRAHFSNPEPENGQMAFCAGDVFHVRDTLHGGVVGSWKAVLVDRNLHEKQEGIIPNKSGAEQILLSQQQKSVTTVDRENSLLRKNFFKRRSARRTKSLNKEGWEDMMFTQSKFPAYENVVRKTPNFPRPVVLYGPVADIARKMLLKDSSQSFLAPIRQDDSQQQKGGGVIKLAAIRQVVEHGKHCVLDVNPNAVDRLNYAGYYPLVIYLRADSKQTVKDIRSQLAKDSHSSAKLYEESLKLEKAYSYLFSATITLTSNGTWFQRLKHLIQESLEQPIWICEKKAENDEYNVQSQRLSHVSSPVSESDPFDQYNKSMMLRWSSDPNMGARLPQQYDTDFKRELLTAVEGHGPPRRYYSNPEGEVDVGDFNAGYVEDEFQSPYARPVPRHRRYQLRPDEEYDQEGESWRAPPVPEKQATGEYPDEQPYPHAYLDQRNYDSESSLRSSQSQTRYRPQSEYRQGEPYTDPYQVQEPYPAPVPVRTRYPDRNGWDNDVLKFTRSTSNPYTKTAPIDRLKMQEIRSRDRPMVPPKPVRPKSEGRYEEQSTRY